jgi:hypothetical protein
MMRLDWRHVLCGVLVGCIIGALAGATLQRSASRRFWRQGPNPERIAQRLSKKLALDADQQKAVREIVEARHAKIMALRQETDAKFGEMRQAMHEDIRKVLRPDQQSKLDELAARWSRRGRKGGR